MREVLLWLGALAWDLALGEPPARLHPVVWLGALAGRLAGLARHGSAARQLVSGVGIVATVVVAPSASVALLGRMGGRWPRLLWLLATLWLLKSTFALRMLARSVGEVAGALEHDDLPAARRAVGALVSRDVRDLDASLVAAAAIESAAENASDSLVAPLFYYALGGLPLALAYRAANTLDAMIGYRGDYEWLGKPAARLDDLLNLVPARLTALLMALAAPGAGGSARGALATLWRDGGRTASPNAGWPMSAAAGALGVRLEKRGHYLLGAAGRPPTAADVRRAVRLLQGTALLATAGYVAAAWCGGRAREEWGHG